MSSAIFQDEDGIRRERCEKSDGDQNSINQARREPYVKIQLELENAFVVYFFQNLISN